MARETMRRQAEEAFGDDLRRARETRGLALEAVSQVTKVPARHIRALEAGDLEEMPGGVFRRGFVRSYLKAIGLEEAVWMRRFEETCRQSGIAESAESDWTAFAENVKNNRATMPRGSKARTGGVGLLLAALALIAWCGWRLATHRKLLPSPMIWTAANSWVDKDSSR